MQVYFGGSRNLPANSQPLVDSVVSAVLSAGQAVHVGCAIGADAQVIQSLIGSSSFSQARVFAAFAQSGAGAWSGSAVPLVQAFERAGGQVSWLAGGSLRVPLIARLMARSVAGSQGSIAAVLFQPGIGSLKVAGAAVKRGSPVFAFGLEPSSPRDCAGRWVASFPSRHGSGQIPVQFAGFSCWQWQPSQLTFDKSG